jgi:hypothetical protein
MHRWIPPLIGLVTLTFTGCTDPVSTAFAGRAAKDVIGDMEKKAQRLMDNARLTGNAMMATAGAEMRFTAQNATLLLADELDKKIEDLRKDERNFLVSVADAAQKVDEVALTMDRFRADASLDLKQIVSQLPLSQKIDFFVERVEGITQFRDIRESSVLLQGIGFADQSNVRQAKITKITLGTVDLVDVKQQRLSETKIRLIFPTEQIAKAAPDDTRFAFVPLAITAEVTKPRTFGKSVKTYKFETLLSVVPSVIGTAELSYEVPIFDWVTSDTAQRGNPYNTPDYRYPGGPQPQSASISAPAKKRIRPDSVGWELTSSTDGPGRAPWSTFEEHPNGLHPKVVYHDSHQRASIEFHTWGRPMTVVPIADYQERRQIRSETKKQSFTIRAGELLRTSIPQDAISWSVSGEFATGRRFAMRRGESGNLMVVPSESQAGDRTDLSFSFKNVFRPE